jgi:leader peptidase (prepilin peptidase)/N-methyltransferase
MLSRPGRWSGLSVALAGGIVGLASGAALGGAYLAAASAILAGCMAAIAFEDWRRLRVPDLWNFTAAISGLAFVWLDAVSWSSPPLPEMGRALLAGVLCGGMFLLLREGFFRLRRKEGLGLGDVKLAAAGGIWLGWELFAIAVMLAALVALAFVVVQTARQRSWQPDARVPLALLLAPAIWLCWYIGQLYAPL